MMRIDPKGFDLADKEVVDTEGTGKAFHSSMW